MLGRANSVSKITSFSSTSSSSRPTLLDYISMCDVYVTPYLNEAQMTSGTLAYSFGLGKAVVSTPYWHARELLSDGRGILVPFGDSKAIGARDRRSSGGRCPPPRYARARLRGEPTDDMGADSRELSCRFRGRAGDARAAASPARRFDRHLARRTPACRKFGSDISSRSATRRACCSTPSFRWRTARTAIASTTTRAPCSSRRRSAQWRDAIARNAHGALCVVHSARMEPGHRPVPQLHELRPPMAGAVGLGGQPRQDALGAGRPCRRRHGPGPPPMGRRSVQDRAPRRARISRLPARGPFRSSA